MAAALLPETAGDGVVVHSAGSDPGEALNPAVVAAMAEVGIDISGGTAEEADRRDGAAVPT